MTIVLVIMGIMQFVLIALLGFQHVALRQTLIDKAEQDAKAQEKYIVGLESVAAAMQSIGAVVNAMARQRPERRDPDRWLN